MKYYEIYDNFFQPQTGVFYRHVQFLFAVENKEVAEKICKDHKNLEYLEKETEEGSD